MKTAAQRTTNDKRGFTLVEVLIAGALGAVLLSALAVSTGLFLDFYKVTLSEQELAIEQHLALDRVNFFVSGDDILPHSVKPDGEPSPSGNRFVVDRRCHFRVELSDRACFLVLVGEKKTRLPIRLVPGEVTVVRH